MQNAEIFWDKIAEKYAKGPIEDMDGYLRTLERTRSYLSPTDNILELGCGTGSTALLLAENVKQITASDLSANMLSIGEAKARDQGITNVKFVQENILEDDIKTGPYDSILALNLLHLLDDAPAAIRRIHSALKPDGLFISKTVCQLGVGTPLKYRIIKAILPLMQMIGKAPYVKFMQIKELEGIIVSGGFKIIETGSYPSRYIVARKI